MKTHRFARDLAVAALAIAAGIHVAVISDHLNESILYGAFFIGVSAMQLTQAMLVALKPSRALATAIASTNVSVIAIWLASRTTGLPVGPHAGVAESIGVSDILAVAFQTAAVVAALRMHRVAGRASARPFVAVAMVALLTTVGASVVLASPSAEDHAAHATAAGADGSGAHFHGAHFHGIVEAGDSDPGPARAPGERDVGTSIAVPHGPGSIAEGFGAVWVASRATDTLTRVGVNGSVGNAIYVSRDPVAVTAGFGRLWVASYGDDVVNVVDPRAMRVVRTVHVGVGPTAVASAGGAVWVTSGTDGTIARIDPRSYVVSRAVATGFGPSGIAAAGGDAWVTDVLDHQVVRVDLATRRVSRRVDVGAGAVGVLRAFGSIWTAGSSSGYVDRIDLDSGRIIARIRVDDRTLPGQGPIALTADGARLYVANNHDKTLTEIDPVMDAVTRTVFFASTLGSSPTPMSAIFADGAVWITNFDANDVVRVPV